MVPLALFGRDFNPINTVAKDPVLDALVTSYANDPTYLAIVNQPVGYSAVDLGRSNTTDNMMAAFIDDAIYKMPQHRHGSYQ